MNAFTLALASARSRLLQSCLCIVSVTCGVALLSSVFLLFTAAERGLIRNAEKIDIVVGAKGSALQLVLSTVYHNDIPIGNINMKDVAPLLENKNIKRAVPIVIGDNYKGWRIVGTTPDYISLYGGVFSGGEKFQKSYEAVAGSMTGLIVGDKFVARHGLAANSDDVHNDDAYKITGTLKPTGTVLDRLILTSVKSVQDMHAHHGTHDEEEFTEQITALLIEVNGTAAKLNLPRHINKTTKLLAATPAQVMAKFMKGTGIGRDILVVLGYLFLGLSALMLLSVLTSGLAERKYDLAVLRVLGAGKSTLVFTVMAEAVTLGTLGSACGLLAGHTIAYAIILSSPALQTLIIPAQILAPTAFDAILCTLGIGAAVVASIIPCLLAARTDIAGLLAHGR